MDSVRKVLTFMGIASLGLVAGFITLSLLMPPSAPPHVAATAVQTVAAAAPVSLASVAAAPASPQAASPSASPAPPSSSGTSRPGDDLHDPDRWSTAQRDPADTDVQFDEIGTPAPAKKPPKTSKPGGKTPRPAPAAPAAPTDGDAPPLDTSRARDLARWKPAITAYSKRHYGEAEWALQPTCIVLHFTAGRQFPWNLVKGDTFDGEAPALASHYVIDGDHIWQLVPPDVRSRGAYGINHRAINIEMIAADGPDLARRPATLRACVALCRWLMSTYGIPSTKVYSHTAVSHMSRSEVPEVLDLVDPRPYGKSDPGEQNMRAIKSQL